ncbi:hypothetical protein ArV2_gp56 [Arthrobacter phage vB_ArS-ArV2]|uniref:Uncharacterized protein n=1 Tax=Arthrobacter phage vB_ArS-ArV2 TaxID=1414742 RepID=V5R9C8_9CAUD|nr:hypothetical protein ArV2_gp56 [Arthrobacter phage vB_ArS-ArV2]AHB31667.1 hypothetical protein ArV2_gp56 [Arthrobacter phage vB_ArS-ArV2]
MRTRRPWEPSNSPGRRESLPFPFASGEQVAVRGFAVATSHVRMWPVVAGLSRRHDDVSELTALTAGEAPSGFAVSPVDDFSHGRPMVDGDDSPADVVCSAAHVSFSGYAEGRARCGRAPRVGG